MFKPVACKDFPGWYEIPGFSKHAANRKGEILTKKTGNFTKGGDVGHYLKVSVYPDGAKEPRMEYVSHLILAAFQGPRPKGMIAMHKDDNKRNNKNSNLKWATQSDNIKLTYKNGLRKPANGYTVSKESLLESIGGSILKTLEKSLDKSNNNYTLSTPLLEEGELNRWLAEYPIKTITAPIIVSFNREDSRYFHMSKIGPDVLRIHQYKDEYKFWNKVYELCKLELRTFIPRLRKINKALDQARKQIRSNYIGEEESYQIIKSELLSTGIWRKDLKPVVPTADVNTFLYSKPKFLLGGYDQVVSQGQPNFNFIPRVGRPLTMKLDNWALKELGDSLDDFASLSTEISLLLDSPEASEPLVDFNEPPLKALSNYHDMPVLQLLVPYTATELNVKTLLEVSLARVEYNRTSLMLLLSAAKHNLEQGL